MPRYKHNDWIIMDCCFEQDACFGEIVLIHHDEIEDDYPDNTTIRKLEVISEEKREGLFKVKVNTLMLMSLQNDNEIIIKDVASHSTNIIGLISK
jgi:hypothetical protein